MHNVFKRFKKRFETRGGDDFPKELDDKLLAYTYADSMGVKRPEVYGIYESVADFSECFNELPKRFVIKPNGFASAKGVFLIERAGDELFDYLSSKMISRNEIFSVLSELLARSSSSSRIIDGTIIVEEYIEPAIAAALIPMDYKFFTHYDEIFEIMQINRNTTPVSYAFFDGKFQPKLATSDHYFSGSECEHIIPMYAIDMLKNARLLSKSIASPFVRLDFFDGINGAYIGEFTPAPGSFTFRNGVNLTSHPYTEKALDLFESRWVSSEIKLKEAGAIMPKIEKRSIAELQQYFQRRPVSTFNRISHHFEISRLQVRSLQGDSLSALKLSTIYLNDVTLGKIRLLIALAWAKVASNCNTPQVFVFERLANLVEKCNNAGFHLLESADSCYLVALEKYEQMDSKNNWINLRIAVVHILGSRYGNSKFNIDFAMSLLNVLSSSGYSQAKSFLLTLNTEKQY